METKLIMPYDRCDGGRLTAFLKVLPLWILLRKSFLVMLMSCLGRNSKARISMTIISFDIETIIESSQIVKRDAEAIARHLTVILQGLGLQLNASKTSLTEDLVLGSMKPDKQEALMVFGRSVNATTIQKTLLKLVIFSRKYKNSGQLEAYLAKINKRLERMSSIKEEVRAIVSIISDLMINNPRTFSSVR